MAERFTPETGPGSREPIKPLRLSEEEPSGLIGFLVWWRKRGGIFWWTSILAVLSVATLAGLVFWIARDVGHLDFRPAPDMTHNTTDTTSMQRVTPSSSNHSLTRGVRKRAR